MAKRKIITIEQDKCTGCGLCIPNCPEGAIQIIDGKARLVSDLFCDGLGACLGHCPEGAITIKEREASDYDEEKVMENISRQGPNVIKAHLRHLKEHKEEEYFKQALNYLEKNRIPVPPEEGAKKEFCGCPGSKVMEFKREKKPVCKINQSMKSELSSWPIQLTLVPAMAPFLRNADLLIAADCTAFAFAGFNPEFLREKFLLIGCPKLDDLAAYQEKIVQIIKNNALKSITYVHMEVPCCFGLVGIIKNAIEEHAKGLPFEELIIQINGEIKNEL